MKSLKVAYLSCAIVAAGAFARDDGIMTAQAAEAPTTKVAAAGQKTEYASLSIDKTNGFVFGWSSQHPTLQAAQERSQAECKKRSNAGGSNCSVVLSWSGAACGVYKTVAGKGSAYGWGVAPKRSEADSIANAHLLKRSKGAVSTNFVWSCNSPQAGTFQKLVDDKSEEYRTVRIGSQVWMARNLDADRFRNGDVVPVANDKPHFFELSKASKPAIFNVDGNTEAGNTYNRAALMDPRGLCPEGFHAPSAAEWITLVNHLGGSRAAGAKLQAEDAWPVSGNNSSGFSAFPYGYEVHRDNKGEQSEWWSTTNTADNEYSRPFQMRVTSEGSSSNYVFAGMTTRSPTHNGSFVRCLKD